MTQAEKEYWMKTTPAKFLIVDDDKVSVMAMQRAMRKLKIVNETAVCHDGQHALEFLAEEVKQHGRLPPYIVTLDLNMPRMGGLEFLEVVRADP
ncbi:response regulator, partial [Roseibium sp.]|uniref:response regulator n=1 Tax=Roseibium sp. TaxID=1936156 RepID=UPI003296C854